MELKPIYIDAIVFAVIGFSALVALMRGFIRETLTLVSLGGAILVAILGLGAATPKFESWLGEGIVATVGAGTTLFFLTLIILSVLTHFIAKLFTGIGLGFIDRILGLLFGAARGYLLVVLAYMVAVLIIQPKEFEEAMSYTALEIGAAQLRQYLPDSMTLPEGLMDREPEAAEEAEPETTTSAEPDPTQGYSPDQQEELNQLLDQLDQTQDAQ